MKTQLLHFFAFALMIILVSCQAQTTSSSSSSNGGSALHSNRAESSVAAVQPNTNSPTTQLVDLMRRLPGVNIQGSHPNVFASVRGTTSTSGPVGVLYVVDNKTMGNDYIRVSEALDITRVKSVNVLKGGQTAIYGVQGAGGVILIRLKRNNED